MTPEPEPFRIVDIEAVEDVEAFAAWGYVILKVQRGEETTGIRVKIASVPQEVVDGLRKQAPRPPVKTVMLDPSMPEAQTLGITTRQKANILDTGDPAYLEAREAYDIKFRNEVVGRGVASKLSLRDGTLAQTPEERYRALEERGLSGHHFTEIAEKILTLTQWTEEERANFMKPASASRPARSPSS